MKLEVIRREFSCSRLGLNHDAPRDFVLASWQKDDAHVSGWYVAYRWMATGLFLSVLVANGSTRPYPSFWFIYLTHWGLVLQTLHLLISAALPVLRLLDSQSLGTPSEKTYRMTWLHKVSWFLYTSTNVLSVVITTVYWAGIFVPGSRLEPLDFFVHGFNSIMSIADIFIGRRPCRLLHVYQPFTVLMVYTIYTLVYWAVGGLNENGMPYIYPVLNWENLAITAPFVAIGLLIALPLLHVILWALHLLRDWLVRRMSVRLDGTPRAQHRTKGTENEGFESTV